MPFLNLKNTHACMIGALILSGCGDESSAYRHIKKLPYSEWNKYAAGLPMTERMSLHKEILDKSGHNPKMTITSSFYDDPEESYEAITNAIKRGDKGTYYLDVIYEINRNPDFDMCGKPHRKIAQGYLWSLATDAVKKDERPKFYTC